MDRPWGIIAALLLLSSCGKQATEVVIDEQTLPPGPADFLAILEQDADFQEYKAGYPDYSFKSQEQLTPEVIEAKVANLTGGPHEAFIATYENLTGTDSLYEVRFGDPMTGNELVAIVDTSTDKVEQIYLWVNVKAGVAA